MALTRDFRETVMARAETDDAFRVGLLTEAAECILGGEVDVAKTLLRDYVNATLGFQELGRIMDKKPESLMRMLSAKGNPRADNLARLLTALREHEGVEWTVRAA